MHTSRRRGQAIVELALLIPWVFFLLIGALDAGFYAHALICTQNAAKVAALYTSSSLTTRADTGTACSFVLKEMSSNPNVGTTLTACSTTPSDTYPVAVTAEAVSGPDGQPASRVTVSYRTANLIPIPGLLPGRITITKAVVMRVRG